MSRSWNARSAIPLGVSLFLLVGCSGSGSSAPATQRPSDDTTESIDETEPDDTATGTDAVDTEMSTTTVPAPPTTLPRETLPMVLVDPDTDEETEVEVDVGGPTTYAGVVDAGVEAGIWTEVEGLTRVLDVAVGALPAAYAPGIEGVASGELNEVLDRAWRLNASGEYDQGELEPLRRRYQLFAPPADVLDEIAAGATEVPAVQGFRGIAAAPACASIDVDEFDVTAWVEGCYSVVQTTLPDATLRVFYPNWYDDDGSLTNLPPIALGALVQSVETYRSLGAIGDMDVVFSATDTIENVTDEGDFYALATASSIKPWDNDVVDGCAITTWPTATEDPTSFEQTIAHEAWHCVQYYDGMAYSGGSQNWWVEGGAEFFSNVAYPSADDEHRRLGTFDAGLNIPIYEMAYEVWPWWQHLSNEFSPLYVADLHRQMMGVGGSAIELFSGYDEIFHDFVADYVAGKVIDQNGSPIQRALYFATFVSPVTKENEGRELKYAVRNWAPMRFRANYAKQLRVFETDSSTGGIRSMVKWEERFDRPSWKGVFPEVRSKCTQPARYAAVLTDTTTDASTTVDFKIVIDRIEEASCDPCVLGTWSLDLDTFEGMILAGMAAQGGALPPGTSFDIGGAYYLALNDEDQVLEQRDGLTIGATVAGVGGLTTTIDSFAEGTYSADGERLVINDLNETYSNVTTSPFGGSFSVPVDIAQGAGTYTCNSDQMVVTVDAYLPVTWNRVDKILTPPDAQTDPSVATPDG